MESDVPPPSTRDYCQWCRAPLLPGAERCQACGAAVPRPDAERDPSFSDLALGLLATPAVSPASTPEQERGSLRSGDPLLESLALIAVAGLVGAVAGWLFLPGPLAQAFRAVLALPTQPADVSRLGLFLGLLCGLFLGTLYRLVARR